MVVFYLFAIWVKEVLNSARIYKHVNKTIKFVLQIPCLREDTVWL